MDDGDLEAELEGLEQEAMDERMLNTGPTPVGTRLEGLPAAGNTERKFYMSQAIIGRFSRSEILTSNSQQAPRNRGRRRGGGTGQTQGRDGHVACPWPLSINIHICTLFSRLFWCRGGVSVFIAHALDAFLPVSYFASKPCCSFSVRVSWR